LDYAHVHVVLANEIMTDALLPPDLMPPGQGVLSLRTAFLNDRHYAEAAFAMTQAAFEINPVDQLWCIHNGMTQVHTAALAHKLGREPTPRDLRELIGFDELFQLFVGAFLASDLPDVFGLGDLIKMFTPKFCFSPLLEYAGANLEAFIAHCRHVHR
jgi:hypothetical protein